MKTRVLLVTFISVFLSAAQLARAQQPTKIPRMGVLKSSSLSAAAPRVQAFQQRLRELGYVDGKNIIIEYRYADGKLEPLAELAAELIRLKVDIIVTDTSNATDVLKNATKTIPVVFTSANDPVGDGQVASLAHPGGNLTGFVTLAPDLNGKRLELLKEAFPKITRVGFIRRAGSPRLEQRFKEDEVAAKALGLQLQSILVKDADDLERAFNAAKSAGVHALTFTPSTFLATNRQKFID